MTATPNCPFRLPFASLKHVELYPRSNRFLRVTAIDNTLNPRNCSSQITPYDSVNPPIWSVSEIAEAVNGRIRKWGPPGIISTDTRTMEPGQWFFAISGENFDGHDFITLTLSHQGCAGVIGNRVCDNWDKGFVEFHGDTLISLRKMAKYARGKFNGCLVGVTGSVGKTTTRNMIALALESLGPVYQTRENWNNQIGVALSLIGMPRNVGIAVLEMGMSGKGEILVLARMARPSIRVILNVGPSHLENFASLEEVALAKGEILVETRAGDVCVLNADDPFVTSLPVPAGVRKVLFGQHLGCDVRLVVAESTAGGLGVRVVLDNKEEMVEFVIPSPGLHLAANACAAATIAGLLGVSLSQVGTSLSKFIPAHMRSELEVARNGIIIINDVYNANPMSTKVAIDLLKGIDCKGKRVAILGDMLELGPTEMEYHEMILSYCSDACFNIVAVVGKRFFTAAESLNLVEDTGIVHACDAETLFISERNLLDPLHLPRTRKSKMHGRPRKAPKPEDAEASATKAANLRSLQSQFLHNHHNKIYTREALDISAKLLEINPECYTAWNYRKLGVDHHLCKAESDPDSIKSIVNEELRVVERALRQNFKSYGAWHHRKWVLSKGYSSIDDELSLVDKFQKADSRNFHAWNYRRFVAASMNRSEEEELNYTTDMINTSFSNYSAWHNRSVLLSHLLERGVQGFSPKEKVLTDEYDFVHQAIFTEPNDQSGWFYYLWLLHQTIKADTPLLVSSWPAHGSDITLSLDRFLDGHALSSFTSFHSDTGMFPLILYFNQAVEGVNLSTITVESIFNSNTDLIWRPLSMNISGSSETWVAFLNFPDVKLHSSEAYPVKVSLGHSQGMTSSSGFHYNSPSQFSFTVRIQLPNSENVDRQGTEKILWKDEHFHIYDTQFQELSPVVPFSQLRIKEDLVTTNTSKWAVETIASEIKIFRELLTTSDCKIGKLTLARLLMAHDINSEEILELYTVLVKMDPSHSQYYKDEHSLVLLKQATSSMESLLKHCYQYRDSTSTNIWNFTCVRFNNLSLSRVGSVEKLLWVQMLDLSHNELRSIEGLEAMQLLSCLNLSNNKLGSFSALEPLRFLSSLKVLDISYNEIGAHSIDTTRYLCSSPLSHTIESDWSSDDVQVRKYWEAYLIFRGLKLRQLDVVGNGISDEKFEGFLVKVVHTLKWLDGEELC